MYTVTAKGTIIHTTSFTTTTPVFDPNTHAQVSSNTTTNQTVATYQRAVQRLITVTVP
jgi:hypothetical protein